MEIEIGNRIFYDDELLVDENIEYIAENINDLLDDSKRDELKKYIIEKDNQIVQKIVYGEDPKDSSIVKEIDNLADLKKIYVAAKKAKENNELDLDKSKFNFSNKSKESSNQPVGNRYKTKEETSFSKKEIPGTRYKTTRRNIRDCSCSAKRKYFFKND